MLYCWMVITAKLDENTTSFLLNNPIICTGWGCKKLIYVLNPRADKAELRVKVETDCVGGWLWWPSQVNTNKADTSNYFSPRVLQWEVIDGELLVSLAQRHSVEAVCRPGGEGGVEGDGWGEGGFTGMGNIEHTALLSPEVGGGAGGVTRRS